MGDGRRDFAQAGSRKFGKDRGSDAPAEVGEGVPVKEEKWSAAMAPLEEVEGFVEGQLLSPLFVPLFFDRSMSL